MGQIEVIMLTLISSFTCLVLPRLLSIILDPRIRNNKSLFANFTPHTNQLTSFPYCMSYRLTGGPSCRFSPDFCPKCSPN